MKRAMVRRKNWRRRSFLGVEQEVSLVKLEGEGEEERGSVGVSEVRGTVGGCGGDGGSESTAVGISNKGFSQGSLASYKIG